MISGFAMPILAIILGDFVGVSLRLPIILFLIFGLFVFEHHSKAVSLFTKRIYLLIYLVLQLQVLSNPDTDAVQAQVRQYALIFVGVGVFSGITNFIMVKNIKLGIIKIELTITIITLQIII